MIRNMNNNSGIELQQNNLEGEIFDMQILFSFLFRNKRLISLVSGSLFIISILYSLTLKKTWQGEFQIVLNSDQKSKTIISSNPSLQNLLGAQQNNLNTQVGILESPSVLMPIFKMVNEENEAWHAGKSKWGKYKNLNKNSIGIELVNKGHRYGYQSFTKIQIKKLVKLCIYLKRKYKIKNKLVLGHSDISPLRKIDPGEKFPWNYLNSKGIGIYPQKSAKGKKLKKNLDVRLFFNNLYKIGYRYLKLKFRKRIIRNFQRRYRQSNVSGILDMETLKISEILAKKSNIA